MSREKRSLLMGRTYSEAILSELHSMEYLAFFREKPFSWAMVSTERLNSMLHANAYNVSVGSTTMPPCCSRSATRRTSRWLGLSLYIFVII